MEKPKFWKKVINALSAAATTGGLFFGAQCREHTVYVRWSGDATGGTVVIETADELDYTGTWAELTSFAWSAGGKQDVYRTTGAYGAIRARISSAITGGGTVTVTMAAN